MALDTEFFVKMPVAQKLLILLAVVVLLGLGYYFLFDAKLTQEYENKSAELARKEADLHKLETVEKEKDRLDRELKDKERKLEKAKEKLPTETEMEKLFLKISEIGEQNGVQFKKFAPQGERAQGNLYVEVPIELNFNGSYLYVMNFFYKVTHLSRIINFQGVDIKTEQKGSGISVKCTAVTYKFKEN